MTWTDTGSRLQAGRTRASRPVAKSSLISQRGNCVTPRPARAAVRKLLAPTVSRMGDTFNVWPARLGLESRNLRAPPNCSLESASHGQAFRSAGFFTAGRLFSRDGAAARQRAT